MSTVFGDVKYKPWRIAGEGDFALTDDFFAVPVYRRYVRDGKNYISIPSGHYCCDDLRQKCRVTALKDQFQKDNHRTTERLRTFARVFANLLPGCGASIEKAWKSAYLEVFGEASEKAINRLRKNPNPEFREILMGELKDMAKRSGVTDEFILGGIGFIATNSEDEKTRLSALKTLAELFLLKDRMAEEIIPPKNPELPPGSNGRELPPAKDGDISDVEFEMLDPEYKKRVGKKESVEDGY